MPYLEKQTKSGDLLEIDQYFAMNFNKKSSTKRKVAVTSEEQEKINERHAQKKLMRLINANFSRKQFDVCVTLTYRVPPEDEATAKKDFNKLTRKLRKYCKENGLPELKYIVTTEKQGQWHHHVILNYIPFKIIAELWAHGRVTMSTLEDKYQFKDLAHYLTQQDKKAKIASGEDKEPRRKFSRRWSSSKNLKQPEVSEPKIISQRTVKGDPKPPKGYRLLSDWKKGCDILGNLYKHFSCVKIEEPTTKPKAKKRE